MGNALKNAASTAREVAHAAVAVVGIVVASAGTVAAILTSISGHAITAAEVSAPLIGIGSAITLLSKLIDSANGAVTIGKAPSAPVTLNAVLAPTATPLPAIAPEPR